MSAHFVYRAYDLTGRPLYVGCTSDLEARLNQHSKLAPWWLFHDRIESVEYDSRAEAEAAETLAIQTEHPRWNKRDRSTGITPGLDYDRDVQRRHRRLVSDEQDLLKQIRKVRMGLAGVRVEVDAIRNGFVLDDEAVA